MLIQSKRVILFLTMFSITGLASTSSLGASLSLDEMAKQIAQQHNLNASRVVDNFTISSSATSVGKNVIFSYILAIRPNTPKNKIDQFVSEWKAEMIPRVCQVNASNDFFKEGLYYTFIYFDRSRKKITQYSVSYDTCMKI
ncbi:MAG: hypothetical protein H6997_09330 [Moraxellaceae bacterium]|nr:hypothetical protein [Moraxellaceae bacterium]